MYIFQVPTDVTNTENKGLFPLQYFITYIFNDFSDMSLLCVYTACSSVEKSQTFCNVAVFSQQCQ